MYLFSSWKYMGWDSHWESRRQKLSLLYAHTHSHSLSQFLFLSHNAKEEWFWILPLKISEIMWWCVWYLILNSTTHRNALSENGFSMKKKSAFYVGAYHIPLQLVFAGQGLWSRFLYQGVYIRVCLHFVCTFKLFSKYYHFKCCVCHLSRSCRQFNSRR